MPREIKIREIECKTALGKCGFPGGGFAINPYVGCSHGCVFCYARFMRRFTNHAGPWGSFVDVKKNISDVLVKQLKSKKYRGGQIYIGTVTDPYQPFEVKYKLTRKILEVLLDYDCKVSILTRSDKVTRDIDLLKQFKNIDVNFSICSLDEKWVQLTEPFSPSISQRLDASKKLIEEGIKVFAMMGPYYPVFTNPEMLLRKFKEIGIIYIFTESFNAFGGNWTGLEKVLEKHYPQLLTEIRETMFNEKKFHDFYTGAQAEVEQLSKKYDMPVTVYFGLGHAGKFK